MTPDLSGVCRIGVGGGKGRAIQSHKCPDVLQIEYQNLVQFLKALKRILTTKGSIVLQAKSSESVKPPETLKQTLQPGFLMPANNNECNLQPLTTTNALQPTLLLKPHALNPTA